MVVDLHCNGNGCGDVTIILSTGREQRRPRVTHNKHLCGTPTIYIVDLMTHRNRFDTNRIGILLSIAGGAMLLNQGWLYPRVVAKRLAPTSIVKLCGTLFRCIRC